MDKTYKPKRYELGTIGNRIKGLDNTSKAEIKASELAKTFIPSFTLRGITVTILKQPRFVSGMVEVQVSAVKGEKPLYVDNPLLYKNPPIMIWDGTYYQEFNEEFKVTLDKMNFVEDPLRALQEMIVQTIELQNK